MKEIINFLKEIFMINSNCDTKIGLSQFNSVVEKKEIKLKPVSKDVKISDLMRRGA